jgi:hypothetical protein
MFEGPILATLNFDYILRCGFLDLLYLEKHDARITNGTKSKRANRFLRAFRIASFHLGGLLRHLAFYDRDLGVALP